MILGIMAVIDLMVFKTMFVDYRRTIKTENYEDSTISAKLKLKFVFLVSLFGLLVFLMLLSYFIVMPIELK